MIIHSDNDPVPTTVPGLRHRTIAGSQHGLRDLEVWVQVLESTLSTPPHRHSCDEVVVVCEGEGTVLRDEQPLTFRAGDTLVIPKGVVHQIVNTGTSPLRLLAALSQSPASAVLPDGSPIRLPWDAGAA